MVGEAAGEKVVGEKAASGARGQRRSPGWPRQADIARLAGVSQTTVSLVINNRSRKYQQISEETRRRVWKAVEELGYVANPSARALAGGRTRVLGIHTFEPVFPIDSRDFYYPFLLGIEEEAEARDYDLMLFTSASGSNRKRSIYRNGVNRLRVADGCVLIGRGGDPVELARLVAEPFPAVFVGRRELAGASYVGADYAAATAETVDFLAGLGHRRIAYLGWADAHEPTVDRRQGYERALRRRDWPIDPALVHQLGDEWGDRELVRHLLDAGATAVLVQDDVLADRVRRNAREFGWSLPEQLSLVVLGDSPWRDGPGVEDWTRFVIPRKEMGQRALRMLIERLDHTSGSGPSQVLLTCGFHIGSTAVRARL